MEKGRNKQGAKHGPLRLIRFIGPTRGKSSKTQQDMHFSLYQ